MRRLKDWDEEENAEFNRVYSGGNCSCHISPPCGSCTHPGNPCNQAEDDDCWEHYEETTMKLNRKNFAEFFRTDYFTVSVIFLEGVGTAPLHGRKQYTYKIPKSMQVTIGDRLLVCTHEQMDKIESLKVVQVVSVNVDAEIEEDSPFQYKWVVGKLSDVMAGYYENLEKDQRLKKAVHKLEQALERVSLRKQLQTALEEIGDDERQELTALFGTDLLGQDKKELPGTN